MQPWRVSAVAPSLFLRNLSASCPRSVVEVLREQAADIKWKFVAQIRVLHKADPVVAEVVCRDAQ